MVSTAGNLFMFCLFGKLATDSYAKMSQCLYESNWLALPLDLRKFFILMIQNSQRSIFYHGFGFIILDLETFSRASVFLVNFFFFQLQIYTFVFVDTIYKISLIFVSIDFQFIKMVFTYYMVFKTITTK